MRRVIKVGGSLLLRPDLVASLTVWVQRQSDALNLLIVGGGEVIDAIRHIDRIHDCDSDDIHWHCVDLLDTNLALVGRWFEWPIIETPEQLAATVGSHSGKTSTWFVAVGTFYKRGDARPLPSNWSTTSDSIAALLAVQTEADELVLLKSCEVPEVSLEELARHSIVDPVFPSIASQIPRVRIEPLGESV